MSAATLPSREEIQRVIALEAYNIILPEYADKPFILRDDDSEPTVIILRPNTGLETIFRKNADGTLKTDDYTLGTPVRTNLFKKEWESLKSEIQRQVQQHVTKFLGTGYFSHGWLDAKQGNNPLMHQAHQLLEKPTVRRAKRSTSVAIANATAGGQIRNPDALGSYLLSKMLGKENISLSLQAASAHATWNDFNYCVTHRKEVERAMALNPNATIMWFRSIQTQGSFAGSRAKHASPTAEEMIGQAKHTFGSTLAHDRQNRELFEYDESTRAYPDAETVWEAFCNLSTAAVRSYPPLHGSHVRLATAAVEAGANPTMSAIAGYMAEHHNLQQPAVQEFVSTMFRESRRRTDSPGRKLTQHSLAQQFSAALNLEKEHLLRLLGEAQPAPEDWEGWMRLMPRSVSQASEIPHKPTKKDKHRDLTTSQWREEMDAIDQFLHGPGLLETAAELERAASLKIIPGRSVALITNHQPEPVMSVTMSHKGHIRVRGSELYSTANLCLNHPDQEQDSSNITTRGLVNDAARNAVEKVLGRHGLTPAKGNAKTQYNMVTEALRRLLKRLPAELANQLSDTQCTRLVQEQIQEMTQRRPLDQAAVFADTWNLNGKETERQRVPLNLYNFFATAGGIHDELTDKNPGALHWALTTALHELEDEINHPGQVVKIVKVSLAGFGLRKNAWKTATSLSTKAMATLNQSMKPELATLVLNALAQANTNQPHSRTVRALLDEDPTRYNPLSEALATAASENNRFPGLARANAQTMTNLLVKHQGGQRETFRSLSDAADYVRALTLNGDPLRSTTWNGLKKASEAWHRNLGHSSADSQWQKILAESNGEQRLWDSLLPQLETSNGLIARCLTSEHQLYQEAKAMQHCVVGYGRDCAKGSCHIYHLAEHGKHIATGEIRRTDGRWIVAQTKATRNHEAPNRAQEAMHEVAAAYTRAWNSAKGRKSNSWTETFQGEIMPAEFAQAAD